MNFKALLSRFTSTCWMRKGSPSAQAGATGSISTPSVIPLRAADSRKVATASCTVSRIVKGHSFHAHRSGFDAGKIQKVVNQGHQPAAIALEHVHVFALIEAQRSLGKQVRRAQNGVERSADIVTDFGQEFGLGPVGCLGRVLGPDQRGVASFAGPDIAQEDVEAGRPGLLGAARKVIPTSDTGPCGLFDPGGDFERGRSRASRAMASSTRARSSGCTVEAMLAGL